MLCRWVLALNEYHIYRKGSLNTHVDTLNSSPCTVTLSLPYYYNAKAQLRDPIISKVIDANPGTSCPPHSRQWWQYPLRRYASLRSQLRIIDGVLCRQCTPNPMSSVVTVPILPRSLQEQALIRESGSWTSGSRENITSVTPRGLLVSIAKDVNQHCQECVQCQQSKLTMPQRAPLTNIPVGKPWEVIAVDILEVPINNHYLLVVQDYSTKWAEAIPIPNQTADRITKELVKIFSTFGWPDILHSYYGRNFESTILTQTLETFGVRKSRTTAYHPQGDRMVEHFNCTLLQLLRMYVETQDDWEKYLPLVMYAYRTTAHSSTGTSPFLLMYGRNHSTNHMSLPASHAFDAPTYSNQSSQN